MAARLLFAFRFVIAFVLLAVNSIVHVLPLLLVAVFKALVPIRVWRGVCNRALMSIAESWIGFNSWMIDHLTDTRIHVEGLPEPAPDGQFLVVCNHQSWVDIPVMQKLCNRRLPLLRFFLKSGLFWVPLLGLAWWALDFPFMQRHTRAQIEKRPELADRDIEATRRACARFRDLPVALVNFVEGTRFTPTRHADQASPYRYLLKPRAGGVAFTLDAMGDVLDQLVDITIVYPQGRPSLTDLMTNRVGEIRVSMRTLPIPAGLRGGDYHNDPAFRRRIRDWINQLWAEKDGRIAAADRQR